MKNYNAAFFILVCFWVSCKPMAQTFDYKRTVNANFFSQIINTLGEENLHLDSVKVYRALMEEKLVERDATTEYKLMNSESVESTVDLQVSKNFNHLYLMQLFTTPANDDLIVYLSTGYSPDGRCTHVGPAYLGNVRIYQIDVKRELKIKNHKDVYWLLNQHKKEMNIIAYDDFPLPEDQTSIIRIKQIILQEANKIGGNKPILFTTERIFKDTNALAFTYFETLKK